MRIRYCSSDVCSSDLFGRPYVCMPLYENEETLNKLANNINQIGFEGKGNTFPITLSGHVDMFKKLRIEVGGNVCIHLIKILQPNEKHKEDLVGNYVDP